MCVVSSVPSSANLGDMCSLVTVHIPEKVGGRGGVEEMKISSTIKPYSKEALVRTSVNFIVLTGTSHGGGMKAMLSQFGVVSHFPTTCPFPHHMPISRQSISSSEDFR